MIDFIKANPLKAAGAFATSISAIFGALWAFDSHYATAADVQQLQQTFTQQIIQDRSDSLDDQIFMLQLKRNQQSGKLDPVDAAMLDRYARQQKQLQNLIYQSKQLQAR